MYFNYFKRPFDLILSILAILILSPIIIVTVLLVYKKHGLPILFAQERPGKDEKFFKMYKFRTMTNEKDQDGNLLSDDERLTRFGRMLRSSSLDELPELINVVKGDMSLVGPRPLLTQYLPYYTEREKLRHSVRPGITGLAQVKGRNLLGWNERFNEDIRYVENVSFFGDLVILFLTVKKVIFKEDIVVGKDHIFLKLDEERNNKMK